MNWKTQYFQLNQNNLPVLLLILLILFLPPSYLLLWLVQEDIDSFLSLGF